MSAAGQLGAEAAAPAVVSSGEAFQLGLHVAVADLEQQVRDLFAVEVDRLEKKVRGLEEQNHVLKIENARLSNEMAKRSTTGHLLPRTGDLENGASMAGEVSVEIGAHSPTLLSTRHTVVAISSDEKESGKVSPTNSYAAHAMATMCKRRHREAENNAAARSREDMEDPLVMTQTTSSGGQNTCEMLPFWQGLKGTADKPSAHMNKTLQRFRKRSQTTTFKELLAAGPMSKRRIVWETIGAMLIISDLVTIPMQAFHAIIDNLLAPEVTVLKAVYWTMDIPCSLFVGFYRNGFIESRFKLTAKNYLKTWFLIDLLLVICDWVLIVMEFSLEEENHFAILRAGRVLRLLRFIRLIRLFKLHAFFSKLFEAIHSEYVLTFLHVTRIVVSIIVVNHFVACLWYAIGSADFHDDAEKSWVGKNFDGGDDLAYRYTTSLHWSITQFTPASMEVVPRNSVERAFAVMVILLGMIAFSTFIGSITQAMTHLRKVAGAKNAQFTQLRLFLGENNVSMELAMRVWRYFEQGTRVRQPRMMWRQVELFADCPELLQIELQHEVYAPVLLKHPLFQYIQDNSSGAMRSICHTAVREASFRTEQHVFDVGGLTVDKAYFVISGHLEYRTKVGGGSTLSSSSDFAASDDEVSTGQWFSEAAIWVKWFHMGSSIAKVPSVLLILSVPSLHQAVKEYTDLLPDLITYGTLFVQQLRAQGVGMSDLPADMESVQQLAAMAFGREYGHTQTERAQTSRSRGIMRRGLSRITQQVKLGDWLHHDRRSDELGSIGEIGVEEPSMVSDSFEKDQSLANRQSHESSPTGVAHLGSGTVLGS